MIGADPLGNNLFVFRSRRGDRLKILAWDGDGYVLWYKRLEVDIFKLPRVEANAGSVELAPGLVNRRCFADAKPS